MYDAGTGMLHLRARQYEPAMGRFSQKDVIKTQNRYTYVRNNPVVYMDPSGQREVESTNFYELQYETNKKPIPKQVPNENSSTGWTYVPASIAGDSFDSLPEYTGGGSSYYGGGSSNSASASDILARMNALSAQSEEKRILRKAQAEVTQSANLFDDSLKSFLSADEKKVVEDAQKSTGSLKTAELRELNQQLAELCTKATQKKEEQEHVDSWVKKAVEWLFGVSTASAEAAVAGGYGTLQGVNLPSRDTLEEKYWQAVNSTMGGVYDVAWGMSDFSFDPFAAIQNPVFQFLAAILEMSGVGVAQLPEKTITELQEEAIRIQEGIRANKIEQNPGWTIVDPSSGAEAGGKPLSSGSSASSGNASPENKPSPPPEKEKQGGTTQNVSPYEVTPTHSKTLSRKDMDDLVEDIAQNGIKESIKVVEVNGEKYVVDGHHRLIAAKRLHLNEIPIARHSFHSIKYQKKYQGCEKM